MRRTRVFGVVGLALGAVVAAAASPVAAGAGTSGRPSGWGPPADLSRAAPLGALVPTSAAVDARGDVLAVWVDTRGSTAPLMAAFGRAGGGWTTRAVPGSRGASDADVGFDAAGNAVAVWTAGRTVRAVRRAAGGAWGAPVTVARGATAVEPRPPNSVQLAVNEHGRAVALWEAPGSPRVAIGRADGSWTPARAVFRTATTPRAVDRVASSSGPSSSSGDTNVVMDRWGRATVLWSRPSGFTSLPVVVSRDPGEAWTKPRPVAPTRWIGGPQQIAGQGNGDLAVAWGSAVRGTQGIRVARKTRDGGWVQTVPLVHRGDILKLRIVLDGSGVVTAVWLTGSGALWRAEQSPGGRWTRPVRVMPPGTAGDEYGLVGNDAGRVLLGSTAPSTTRSVWAMRRSPSRVWQAGPTTVSDGRGQARGPAVAIGPTGVGALVWSFQASGAGASRIQASRFVP